MNTIMMISKWMHCIAIMLDKENQFDGEEEQVRKTILEALELTIKCFDDKSDFPLAKHKNDLPFLVDIIFGIICLCKQDFQNMRPLALKVGGFPDLGKLNSFFFLIRKNKNSIL